MPNPPDPPNTRQRQAQIELKRVANQAGFNENIGNFRDALQDMAEGLTQECKQHRNGNEEDWSFAANLHAYAAAFNALLIAGVLDH